MKQFQSQIALLCVGTCVLYLAPVPARAADVTAGAGDAPVGLEAGPSSRWYNWLGHDYRWRKVPPIRVANSSRLDQLIRAGNLYLSLQDAVSLALENNIDIEIQRYGYDLADNDLFRARATGNIDGVATVPSSLTSSVGATNFLTSDAALPTAAAPPTFSPIGVNIVNGEQIGYDPIFQSTIQWAHLTTPEQNTITTGTTSLASTNATSNFSVSQAFMSGTTATLSYTNLYQNQNSLRNLINPFTTSGLDLTVTQHLLQGRGWAVNNRPIRIAKNNQKINDLVFQQQVINTVANVLQLYWGLVEAIESVGVAQESVAYSQKLLEDNQKQVDVGTLAPVEVTRARAELANDRGALITAQTIVLQQETILKNALSRTGVSNPQFATAHVIPTDRVTIPQSESSQTFEDLVREAFSQRPELKEANLQIDSARINLEGVRSNMLPQLDAVADVHNSALTGPVNALASGVAPSVLVGGYSNSLSQLFFRNFPNYSAGVTMTIPLRNRAAEANMATAQVNLRVSEQSVQRMENLIRVDVQNALIAVEQARIKHEAAVEQVALEQELLDAENKKLSVGTSTPFQVILVQRDLANAQLSEVQAVTAYALAKVQLDQSTGVTLDSNRVEIQEARSGQVSRPASPIPAVPPGAANGNPQR